MQRFDVGVFLVQSSSSIEVASSSSDVAESDGGSTNFNNKMEIVDLDVIRVDDIPNGDF